MNYIWQQPESSFPTWFARGIDCLVLPPQPTTGPALDSWCKSADKSHLGYILPGDGSAEAHYADARCVGVMIYPDEPNAGHVGDPNYRSPGFMLDAAYALRGKTNKPLWISLGGWAIQYNKPAEVAAYCQCADVVSFDLYIINMGMGPGAIPKIGDLINTLAASSKRVVADVETSWQKIPPGVMNPPVPGESYRAPTGAEFVDEVLTARNHNADVLYFSHISGGGSVPWQGFDGTTPEIAALMTVLNRH